MNQSDQLTRTRRKYRIIITVLNTVMRIALIGIVYGLITLIF